MKNTLEFILRNGVKTLLSEDTRYAVFCLAIFAGWGIMLALGV